MTLRIPQGYSPSRPYPLLYALHGSGGNAYEGIQLGKQLLKDDVDKYVIAAPTRYRPQDFYPCETPAILRTIKQLVHIDSDRVWVTGFSAGACSSWALAVLQPDEFTAAIPMAGTLYIGPQTPAFLANMAHTYVLNVWGAKDNLRGWDADSIGIAKSNRRLRVEVEKLGLPVDSYEYPDRGHGGVNPPRELLIPALQRRREHYPQHVHHTFQHPCQAKAYWLERNPQEGELASSRPAPLDRRPGENVNRAIERALDSQRGVLRGDIEGQTIRLHAENAGEITVWIGDGMIDWQKPVRVLMDDHEVFHDTIEPDLRVCLTQAARTLDFDRLRWAGLIVRAAAPAELVTGAMTVQETPDED
jgi:predicted esterase